MGRKRSLLGILSASTLAFCGVKAPPKPAPAPTPAPTPAPAPEPKG